MTQNWAKNAEKNGKKIPLILWVDSHELDRILINYFADLATIFSACFITFLAFGLGVFSVFMWTICPNDL